MRPVDLPTLLAPLSRRAVAILVLASSGLLASFVILSPYYWPASSGLDVTGHPIGRDFINNWVGARLAVSGEIATLFDVDAYAEAISRAFGAPLMFHNWSYPPHILLYLWPLAPLPYFPALAVWTLALFAGFAALCLSQIPASQRIGALVLLALAPACLINMVGGQNGFLTGGLLIGGMLALDRRPWLAGLLFGLLTFKPHIGIVLPFVLIALGAWRAIASACLTTLALVAVSILAFGIEPWQGYITVTSAFQMLILERFIGFFPYMLTSVYAGARTFGLSSQAAWAIQASVSAPVLVATIWAVRNTSDQRLRTSLVVCAVPLLTPYAFNYDLTAIAAVIVWRLSGATLDPAFPRLFAAWLIPALLMPLNMLGFGIAPLVILALYLTILGDIARSREPRLAPALPQPVAAY